MSRLRAPIMNEQEKQRWLKEITNSPEKVALVCTAHNYFGDIHIMPTRRCVGCWKVYYFRRFAEAPPHMRGQVIQELAEIAHHIKEAADRGEWDFEPFLHPIIKIEKE